MTIDFSINKMRQHWDEKANFYNSYRTVRAPDYAILNIIDHYRPGNILEIGFGPCVTGKLILEKHKDISYFGIDLSLKFVQIAKKSVKQRGFLLQSECTKLPFKSESFDMVFEMDAIHHFPRYMIMAPVEEMNRILRKGGIAIIAEDWGKQITNEREKLAYSLQQKRKLTKRGFEYHPKDDEWKQIFEDAGMMFLQRIHTPRPLNLKLFETIPDEAVKKELNQLKLLWGKEEVSTDMTIQIFQRRA